MLQTDGSHEQGNVRIAAVGGPEEVGRSLRTVEGEVHSSAEVVDRSVADPGRVV